MLAIGDTRQDAAWQAANPAQVQELIDLALAARGGLGRWNLGVD